MLRRKIAVIVCAFVLLGLALVSNSTNSVSSREPASIPPTSHSPPISAQNDADESTTAQFKAGRTLRGAPVRPIVRNRIPDTLANTFQFSPNTLGLEESNWKIVANAIAAPLDPRDSEPKDALFRIPHHALIASHDSTRDSRGRQIVFNSNRNRVGVLTGTVMIELFAKDAVNQVASEHSLHVTQFAENINTLFVSTSTWAELNTLRTDLLNDKKVKRIEIEILENSLGRQ